MWCYERECTLTTNGIFTQCVIAIDLVEGKWVKFQLRFDSAGRMAVGDMRGLGLVVPPETHWYISANLTDCNPIGLGLPRSPRFRAISKPFHQPLKNPAGQIQCKMKLLSRS